MRIIADGGSTKVCWAIENSAGEWHKVRTEGLNPALLGPEETAKRIEAELLPLTGDEPVEEIHYFGAGCTAELSPTMMKILQEATGCNSVEVGSDMLGAARSLCGSSMGIACILGTGSNSCLYDGSHIADSVGALGFILGDEGSGASIGRRLLGDIFKRQMPREVVDDFAATMKLTQAEAIERVYRQPAPNRFLASMMPFVARNICHEAVDRLVTDEFLRFLDRNVLHYTGCHDLPVNFTGSVASHFHVQLEKAMNARGLRLGRVEADPIDGLIRYYSPAESDGHSFSRR